MMSAAAGWSNDGSAERRSELHVVAISGHASALHGSLHQYVSASSQLLALVRLDV